MVQMLRESHVVYFPSGIGFIILIFPDYNLKNLLPLFFQKLWGEEAQLVFVAIIQFLKQNDSNLYF